MFSSISDLSNWLIDYSFNPLLRERVFLQDPTFFKHLLRYPAGSVLYGRVYTQSNLCHLTVVTCDPPDILAQFQLSCQFSILGIRKGWPFEMWCCVWSSNKDFFSVFISSKRNNTAQLIPIMACRHAVYETN
jgi:hypothetical protein